MRASSPVRRRRTCSIVDGEWSEQPRFPGEGGPTASRRGMGRGFACYFLLDKHRCGLDLCYQKAGRPTWEALIGAIVLRAGSAKPVSAAASRRAKRTRKLVWGGSWRFAGPTVTQAAAERGQLGQGTLALPSRRREGRRARGRMQNCLDEILRMYCYSSPSRGPTPYFDRRVVSEETGCSVLTRTLCVRVDGERSLKRLERLPGVRVDFREFVRSLPLALPWFAFENSAPRGRDVAPSGTEVDVLDGDALFGYDAFEALPDGPAVLQDSSRGG